MASRIQTPSGNSRMIVLLATLLTMTIFVTMAMISAPACCMFFQGPCVATYYSVVQVATLSEVEGHPLPAGGDREYLAPQSPAAPDTGFPQRLRRERREFVINNVATSDDVINNVATSGDVNKTSPNTTQPHFNVTTTNEVPDYATIEEALAAHASYNPSTGTRTIVLSSVDNAYVDMALNLWESSFLKFNITHFLFVCSDRRSQMELARHGLPCFRGKEDKDADEASVYGSAAFRRKTHLKTSLTLDALTLGYQVLLMDVDIVMLKDPFPYFTCHSCDMEVQSDGSEINSGFLFVRPTPASINMHSIALEIAARDPTLSNQKTIAQAIYTLRSARVLKLRTFNSRRFPRGSIFFEQGHRMFLMDHPCNGCVIVHNNWIRSGAAKVYRFKEFGMWMVDKNGYYSNPKAKYLIFDNPLGIPEESKELDLQNLRTGLRLGALLNRTLILPTFHCYNTTIKSCRNHANHSSLNTYVNMEAFEHHFAGLYREHVFLYHPKVPSNVVNSQSENLLILSNIAQQHLNDEDFHRLPVNTTFTPADKVNGANSTELLEWLRPYEHYSVLRFHSLYDAFKGFSESEMKQYTMLENSLQHGILGDNYRQSNLTAGYGSG